MGLGTNTKDHSLFTQNPTPPIENLTINEYLKLQYPVQVEDLIQGPLKDQVWWKFQTMSFHHLLRLHPDHPNELAPNFWDPRILAGPVAKHTLLIRDIVLEMRKEMKYDNGMMPREIKEITPLLRSLTSLEHLTCMYTIYSTSPHYVPPKGIAL